MSELAFARPALQRRGLRLEYLTVGWNVGEGLVALLGFGIDSFVETGSGGILVWRLLAEGGHTDPEAIEAVERRAQKLVAVSLFGLAAYIFVDSLTTLVLQRGS